MTQDERRDTIHFSRSVDPGKSVELTKEMENAATVEKVEIRIYRGAEFALEVEPFKYVEPGSESRREPLLQYRGRDFVAGDGDRFAFPISREVNPGQKLGVEVRNQAQEFTYNFNVEMIVEYSGGSQRTAAGLLGGLF